MILVIKFQLEKKSFASVHFDPGSCRKDSLLTELFIYAEKGGRANRPTEAPHPDLRSARPPPGSVARFRYFVKFNRAQLVSYLK